MSEHSKKVFAIKTSKTSFKDFALEHAMHIQEILDVQVSLYIHMHLSIYLYIPGICAQLCPTLCDPQGCNLPGFFVYGILQARILEWVAFSFSRGSPPPRGQTHVTCIGSGFFATEPLGKSYQLSECMLSSFSHVQLFATLWTIALQAPVSLGFSKQEFWGGLPFLSPINCLPICLFIYVITLMKANVI